MGPETNRNAATHGARRRKLNRLARRPQGYRKSLAILVDSLALAGLKRGWLQHAGPCQEYPGFCLPGKVIDGQSRSNQTQKSGISGSSR